MNRDKSQYLTAILMAYPIGLPSLSFSIPFSSTNEQVLSNWSRNNICCNCKFEVTCTEVPRSVTLVNNLILCYVLFQKLNWKKNSFKI